MNKLNFVLSEEGIRIIERIPFSFNEVIYANPHENIILVLYWKQIAAQFCHTAAIQPVEIKSERYRFQVMDPDYGKIKPLELKHVQGANYRRAVVVQ